MKLWKRELGIFSQLSFLGFGLVGLASILGPGIIASPLLAKAYFWMYPNVGKIAVILAILMGIKEWEVLKQIPWTLWKQSQLWWGLLVVCSYALFVLSTEALLQSIWHDPRLIQFLLPHLALWLLVVSWILLSIAWKNVVTFVKLFYPQLILLVLITPLLDLAIFQIWKLWPLFSGAVLFQVAWLLSWFYHDVHTYSGFVIQVQDFAVRIAESCSGIDSLFMYLLLMGGIGALEWKRLRWSSFVFVVVLGLIGVYFLNTIRVFTLILLGVEVSRDLAVHLFHTYAGMVLFLGFFFVFLRFSYRRLVR